LSVRKPELAAHLAARGARVRRGDFDDPATLDFAFEGADRVFIVSTTSPNEKRFVQQKNAIDAARSAAARTVLYTSILQRRGSPFVATAAHVDTEDYLEQSAGSYTIVRNAHYFENLPMFLGGAIRTGELLLPPDGASSWVAASSRWSIPRWSGSSAVLHERSKTRFRSFSPRRRVRRDDVTFDGLVRSLERRRCQCTVLSSNLSRFRSSPRCRFDELGSPSDVKGYLTAHDEALTYDFDTLIAGHVNRLGTRADVTTDQQYLADLETSAAAALQSFDMSSIGGRLTDPSNVWAYGAALLDAWPKKCVDDMLAKWRGKLGAVDVFAKANCTAMQSALRAGDLP
jgi:hypothetical protein